MRGDCVCFAIFKRTAVDEVQNHLAFDRCLIWRVYCQMPNCNLRRQSEPAVIPCESDCHVLIRLPSSLPTSFDGWKREPGKSTCGALKLVIRRCRVEPFVERSLSMVPAINDNQLVPAESVMHFLSESGACFAPTRLLHIFCLQLFFACETSQ